MKRFLLQNILFVLFHCSISLFSNAQSTFELDKSIDLNKYVGTLEEKDIYLAFDNSNGDVLLLEFKDSILTSNIKLSKKQNQKYLKFFIYQEKLYSLVQYEELLSTTLKLHIFNNKFIAVDSVEIIKNIDNKFYNRTFKIEGNQFALIGKKDKKGNDFNAIIYNLDNQQLSNYSIQIDEKENLTLSDFCFTDKQDLYAVFEGEENYHTNFYAYLKEKKIKAYLFMTSNKVSLYKELNLLFEDHYIRSFKLNKINDKDIKMASLVFSNSIKGHNLLGYKIFNLKFENTILDSVPLQRVNFTEKETLWNKKDLKYLKKYKHIPDLQNQHIKDFLSLEDGSFLVISESFITYDSETSGISIGTSTNSATGNSTPTFDFSDNINGGHYDEKIGGTKGEIIISKFSQNSNNAIWFTKTLSRMSASLTLGETSYLKTINSDNSYLGLFYNTSQQMEGSNVFKTTSFNTSLFYFEINLNTGDIKNQLISNPSIINEDYYFRQTSHLNYKNQFINITKQTLPIENKFIYKLNTFNY